jgi:Kef-type K+ transport system membrane component KefB
VWQDAGLRQTGTGHMSLTLLFLQLTVILVTARTCGLVLRAFGQPMVIGEMAAGSCSGRSCSARCSRSGINGFFPQHRFQSCPR